MQTRNTGGVPSRSRYAPAPARQGQRNRRRKKRKNKTSGLLGLLIVVLTLAVAAMAAVRMGAMDFLPISGTEGGTYALYDDVQEALGYFRGQSAQEVRRWPKVYVVPLETYVAPLPDPAGYDESFTSYSDETITVTYSTQMYYSSHIHFADIRIKHPSQLRMALADDAYGNSHRAFPSEIAKSVNAVAAINGCFYNTRTGGWLIYRRQMLRNVDRWFDVLLIDSDGNLYSRLDHSLRTNGFLEEHDIVSALSFGLQLVQDGKAKVITTSMWQPDTLEPRAAICQYSDGLHYMICVAEGRCAYSKGLTMQQFANLLASKKVDFAYNLDGGKSATMVIGGHTKNTPAYGNQRELGDILYFATGIDHADAADASGE